MDLRVGMTLAFAILAALYARRRTGIGQHIDLAAREAISCLVGHTFLHHTMNGESPQRQGNLAGPYAPHGCYRCRGEDRWVTLSVQHETEWRALCQAISHPEWLDEPRFATAASRVQHRQALDTLLTAWTQEQTPEEVTTRLQQAGVAAFPTMDSAMLADSEHLRARGAFITVSHPKLGPQTVLGPPWRSPGVTMQPDRSSPLLGEHTAVVLRELLKVDDAEITRLIQAGVLE